MMFSAVLHKELLWDFSFSVLGHGIITLDLVPKTYQRYSANRIRGQPILLYRSKSDLLSIYHRPCTRGYSSVTVLT